jgi:hypothetical protein
LFSRIQKANDHRAVKSSGMQIASYCKLISTRISVMDLKSPRPTDYDEHQKREKGLDQTLAESFPSSDPPSTIPDPIIDEVPKDGEMNARNGIAGKADIAFRNTVQNYLDRAGIKLDLEHFESNIRQQPLIAAAIAAAAGFIFGGGAITRLGSALLALKGRKAVRPRGPKPTGSIVLTRAR